MLNCCHCNRPVPGTHIPGETRPSVCDGCAESIRTTRKPLPAAVTTTDATKPRTRRRRPHTGKAATTLLLILSLIMLSGCGASWAGSLQVEVDSATILAQREHTRTVLLDLLRRPPPEIPPAAPATE